MREQTLVKGMHVAAKVLDDETLEYEGVRYRREGAVPEGAVKVRLSWSEVNGSLVVEAEAGPKDGILTAGEYLVVPTDPQKETDDEG